MENVLSQHVVRDREGGRDQNQRRDPRDAPTGPTHETIARKAYEIWRRHGSPQGTEYQDWLAAEAELRSPR